MDAHREVVDVRRVKERPGEVTAREHRIERLFRVAFVAARHGVEAGRRHRARSLRITLEKPADQDLAIARPPLRNDRRQSIERRPRLATVVVGPEHDPVVAHLQPRALVSHVGKIDERVPHGVRRSEVQHHRIRAPGAIAVDARAVDRVDGDHPVALAREPSEIARRLLGFDAALANGRAHVA